MYIAVGIGIAVYLCMAWLSVWVIALPVFSQILAMLAALMPGYLTAKLTSRRPLLAAALAGFIGSLMVSFILGQGSSLLERPLVVLPILLGGAVATAGFCVAGGALALVPPNNSLKADGGDGPAH